MAGDMPTGAGGPSRRRHARAARTTPYARPADGQQTNAAPALNAHWPSESPGSGWGGFARSLASTPLKAAAGLKGWMFGSASPESAAENGLANGNGIVGARQAHSRESVDGRQPQGTSDNEVEEGPTADNGRAGSAQPLPALSSVHSEQARADSQMAAMVQPDRAVQMEFDSAASPSQPRRGGRQPKEQQQQQQRQLDRPASTPGTDAERDGGAAGEDGDATPFDNVLSVLERIKRRQSTPFSLAPGRQPAYSPVPFAGMAEGAPQRSRLGGGSLTPYATGGPQRPGQHRPAPYTAPRPAARQQFPALQLGSGGGGLFGEAQHSPPQEAAAAEPQPRLQAGGLFAQTASTPASAPRLGRRLGGLGGTPASTMPMAGVSRPLAAGSPLALAGPRSGGLGWTPMRGGALGGGAMATAGSSLGFGSAISARGAKRGREDDGDADAPAAAAGTPLLGSGWGGAAERASAAKRLRPEERRLRAGASSLQPRGPAEAADAAAPVSTNAARRILMALETMTQTPPQSAASSAAALPPPTLSLGPPVETNPEPPTSQPGKAAAPAKPVSHKPRQPAQPAAEAIDTEPTTAHQPQETAPAASEAPAAAAPAAAASSGGGWGAALLHANKAAASAATAAVEAEIEKAKGGSAEQASKPAMSFSFGVAPAAAPAAASAPPAQQPMSMLADSTNSFVVPSFRFGESPPAPKAKKVAKLVRGVPANIAGSSGSGRTFRFGMPLEEESPSPSPPSSPTAQPPLQAKEAFSLANQVAAAAAQLPLPPEEDAAAAEPPAVTQPPPAAEKPADPAPAASSGGGGGGGWGAALLQANAAASRKATEAVEAEIKKAAGGGDISAAAAPAFSFGAKAAGGASASDSAPAAPVNGLFGFSATPALSPPSLPFAFGAPPTSQVNDKSAESAAPAAKLADSEPASGPAAVSFAFGTTSAPLTFNIGSSAAGGGFAFGASSAPAAAAESTPAAQAADAAPSAAATAASSGPAPLSFSFGTAAPASTEAGGSAAPTPSMSAAPSFAFGAGAAPAVGGSGGAATPSALPASAPAFSFGGAATPAEEAPAENGGLQRQNSLGAASNMSMTSVDGGNGANSGSLAAPDATPSQPAASSFATFGSTQGAGFSFVSQTAPSTPFGGAASSAAATSSATAGSAAAPGAFAFGASSAPAFGAIVSAPAFGSGGFAPAFGGASAPAFSTSAPSFGGGAASAPAFGGSSAPAFGTTPAPFGGFGSSAAQAPSAPVPLSFSFGSSTNASAPAFGAGGSGASAPQPAGGPQPGGFAFGTGGGGAAGGSTSLPAFSTTALGASQPGGAPQAAAATFGAPQTGSMTLGAAPGDAGGAAARRKVKLRRPGRR